MEAAGDPSHQKFLKRKDSVNLPSYFNESTFALESLKEILMSPLHQRSEAQINALIAFSKNIKFFGELRNNINDAAHAQCCQCLTYACFPSGSYVFREGDPASRFYIILVGSCAVISSTVKPDARPGAKPKPQLLTVLRQGDCFGEIALISNKRRLASLMCREDCHFAVLEREDYRQILWKIQNKQLYEKVELLMQHPIFSSWKKEAVQRLSYFFKMRSLRQGQSLFTAGQQVNEVFLIKEGVFQLTKNTTVLSSNKRKKKQQTRIQVHYATVGPGEMLGATQALEGNAFEYSCLCRSEFGEVLLITKQHFRAVIAGENKIKTVAQVDRDRERTREEQTIVGTEVKEARSEIPPISDEFYRRLTEKLPLAGEKPIIYQPKPRLEGMSPIPSRSTLLSLMHLRHSSISQSDTSLPEIVTRALRVSEADSRSLNASFVDACHPPKKAQEQQQKWRDLIFNPKRPKLITDGVDLYRHHSLPRLEKKANTSSII